LDPLLDGRPKGLGGGTRHFDWGGVVGFVSFVLRWKTGFVLETGFDETGRFGVQQCCDERTVDD